MDCGNSWRTTTDIAATWNLLGSIADQNHPLFPNAGPGRWNDPDMLEIGNGNLTTVENKSHMSLWCIMAAPLLAGNDVRSMNNTVRDIYCNEEAIAVNQDSLGVQGRRVRDEGNYEVWFKPLKNWVGKEKAVVLFNRGSSSRDMDVQWEEIGLDPTKAATVRDLWEHEDMGSFTGEYSTSVAAHGTTMLKIVGEPELHPLTQDSYLSDLEWYHMANGLGPAEKDESNGDAAAGDGRTITLAGTTYDKGLGVHAPSDLVYYLGGCGVSFTAKVGVDDEVGNSGSVRFIVYGDTTKLFTSGEMTGNSATKSVDVDVEGVQVLRLLVTQWNIDNNSDKGDWADAHITYTNVPILDKPVIDKHNITLSTNLKANRSILRYTIPQNIQKKPFVSIRLYDVKGTLIKTLVNERHNPGGHSIEFDIGELAAGSYICTIKINNCSESIRVIKPY